MTKKDALALIARAAVETERRFQIPAELVAAQTILESGWLCHAPGNNPFGIKWSPSRHSKRQLLTTREWLTPQQAERFATDGRQVLEQLQPPRESDGKALWRVKDWFAVFDSLTDAIVAYGRLLSRSSRYQKVLAAPDWRSAIDAVAAAGYSTAPDYAAKLKACVTDEVLSAIAANRAATGPQPKSHPPLAESSLA